VTSATARETAPPVGSSRIAPRAEDRDRHRAAVVAHFDAHAARQDGSRAAAYEELLARYHAYFVPRGARVLEVGCGTGDLLAALSPSEGVGVDCSPEMIRRARTRHAAPGLHFMQAFIEDLDLQGATFDYIILSDVVGTCFDILETLRSLRRFCHERTHLVCNVHSRLWQPALKVAQSLGRHDPFPGLAWVTREDLVNLLVLAGFEITALDSRIVCPARVPLLGPFMNRVLAPFAPFRWLCLSNWVVARAPVALPASTSVSVICACRNEAGNIPVLVERFPEFGSAAELIFVEGGSSDDTYGACRRAIDAHPELDISLHRQTGRGKGDAVRTGFAAARNDILVILDADMTVRPEDLPAFVDTLRSGKAEFVNGSRLVYPMEGRAMRFLNLLGNKFFSLTFTWLLGQPVKDTLCGTKVLLRSDYEKLAARRAYFGEFDPFGDFDLLFGASRLGLRILDLPVRYRDRTYGATNISRFKHGLILMRMSTLALLKLKMR
jgi:SAM-dependent methyltransferase